MTSNLSFTFNAPIVESAVVNSDFIIRGTAINQTVTSNNHKFLSEELRPAAETLTGVPLLVDHENKVENIKGRVIRGSFNEADNKVDFEAKVMDEDCKNLIKDGRLNSVSVGATVENVESGEDGTLIPRGIKFKELSLVAVPADDCATFQIAMSEAYSKSQVELHREENNNNKLEIKPIMKGGYDMVENKVNETVNTSEAIVQEVKVEEKIEVDYTAKIEEAERKVKDLEESNKKLSEQVTALTPKAKIINEFDATEDVRENYKIVQDHKGFSLIMNKY